MLPQFVMIKISMKKLLLLLLFCSQILFSCKKNGLSESCQTLHNGIINNDTDKARSAINSFIDQLPSKIYNEANLTVLVQKISTKCNVNSTMLCFDCIKTLPSQSEIRITINAGGTSVARTIDIDYSSNNIMTFRNMHD
jgi:hypothetical protein